MNKKLNKIFEKSKKIKIDKNSKLVIMSDCHRGSGTNYDNFLKNRNIYESALMNYYKRGFTYIELGDGDDMWEVKNYKDIIEEHLSTFKILKKFNDENRLIMIYGNHDICKRSKKIMEKYFYKYYNKKKKKEETLLNNLEIYESLILEYYSYNIFLIHGHQVDLLNSTFWRLSRFLVRHFWRNAERFVIKDPTSAAKNYRESKIIEKKLKKWSIINNKMLVAGHTHRPIFPKLGHSLYFNDGSCIHPSGITCLEIEKGNITLVKWLFKLKKGKYLVIERNIIEGSEPIINFFRNLSFTVKTSNPSNYKG